MLNAICLIVIAYLIFTVVLIHVVITIECRRAVKKLQKSIRASNNSQGVEIFINGQGWVPADERIR